MTMTRFTCAQMETSRLISGEVPRVERWTFFSCFVAICADFFAFLQSIDSPSFFNSSDIRDPPPTSLILPTNGHVSRTLLNFSDDVPDFKTSVTSSR
jgi:hypothetical protein